jgi:hypothetical protein
VKSTTRDTGGIGQVVESKRKRGTGRNREVENLHEIDGVMLDSCFTTVTFYEMMRIYRDRPEAYLEDTVKLQEILRVLNLQ